MDENTSQTPITPQPAQGSRLTLAFRLALAIVFVGLLVGTAYVLSINKNAQTTTGQKEASQKNAASKQNYTTTAYGTYDCIKDPKIFTSLQEAEKDPKKVCFLNLAGQHLTQFPPEIFEFKNIRTLILSNNNIQDLPKSLTQLKYLQTLILKNNPINKDKQKNAHTLFPQIGVIEF